MYVFCVYCALFSMYAVCIIFTRKEVIKLPMKYKIDVLAALKAKGYTTYKLRIETLLSESAIQKLRTGKGISWDSIETICKLLECQPGDILEYTET